MAAHPVGRPAARRLKRFAGALTTVLALGVGMIAANSAPAAALPGVPIVCKGPVTLSYSPGLTLETQAATYNGQGKLSACTSTGDQRVSTGSLTTTGQGSLSCISGMASGTTRVQWSDDSLSSTYEHTNIVTLQTLGVTLWVLQGHVTDGWYEGAGLTQVLTMAPPVLDTLDCLTNGMSALTGPTVLTFHTL